MPTISNSKYSEVKGITRLLKNTSTKLVKYAWVKLPDGNIGQIIHIGDSIGKVRLVKSTQTVDLTTVTPMKMYFYNNKEENLGEMCYACADWVKPNMHLRGQLITVKSRAKEKDTVFLVSTKIIDSLDNPMPQYPWLIESVLTEGYRIVRGNNQLIVKRTDFKIKGIDEYNIISPICPTCNK